MVAWSDLVPESVARRQERWERKMRVYRAHHAGAAFSEIGRGLGLSTQRAYQLYALGSCLIRSPVEEWLAADHEVRALARLVEDEARREETRGDWNELCGLPRDFRPAPYGD